MVELLWWYATLLLSMALGLYLTPAVRKAALRYGVLDHPDGRLKHHREPTPYLGGIAVYLSFLITLGVVFEFEPALLGLLLSGTIVAMLGLFDDLRVLPPRVKLGGQCLAALVLLKSGIAIQLVAIPPWLALPLTLLWIAGITNALNIIDVSDGLSTGVAAIAGIALFVLAALSGNSLIAVTTLALVGSLLGFLRYNQPPARIYLGDTGSMFIGFMLAALAMIGSYTERTILGALAPLCILFVPILDTALVSCARLGRGMSPFKGSPDHFALRLAHRGWSPNRVAAYGYFLGGVGGAMGIAMTLVDEPAALTIALGAALLFVANFVWLWRMPTRGAPQATAPSAPEEPVPAPSASTSPKGQTHLS